MVYWIEDQKYAGSVNQSDNCKAAMATISDVHS
jgi:hypothetical protein